MQKADELRPPSIRFVGEQDGPAEKELKRLLCAAFGRRPAVMRAYLARVRYDDGGGAHVALVLAAVNPSRDDVDVVQRIFHTMFNSRESLDVLFATDAQERELSTVCRAFFSQR